MAGACGPARIGRTELRQLKHFLAVAEAGSITAAAKRLRLTQPVLSRQMKALDEEFGTALLERGAHSFTLTPARVRATAAGELDLIVAAPCAGLAEPIRWVALRDYGWQVVMPASHPFAAKAVISAEDHAGQWLLLYDR